MHMDFGLDPIRVVGLTLCAPATCIGACAVCAGVAWVGGGPGTRRGQCVFDGVAHTLVHLAAVAKTHLDLGGVHVDVNPRWVHGQVQRVDRLAVAVQHVFVSTAGRVGQHLVAHKAAIHVTKLLVGTRARGIRDADATPHAQCSRAGVRFGSRLAMGSRSVGRAPVHDNRLRDEIRTQHIAQTLVQTGH